MDTHFRQRGNGRWASACDQPISETRAKNQQSRRQLNERKARSGSRVNVIKTIWSNQHKNIWLLSFYGIKLILVKLVEIQPLSLVWMQRTQYCYSNTVCMSVLLSVRFRTATKATVVINIFAQLIAPLSYFLRTKLHSKILTGLPITRDKTASTALASSYLSPYCLPTSSHSSSRRHLRSAVSRQRFFTTHDD